ncbi:MAG: regulator [Bacteroidota bacterium]
MLPALLYVQGQVHKPCIVRNFEKQSYGGESQNWSVTKDSAGYIFAANNTGLLEFDGVEWRFYPSPGGTIIRSVAIGGRGRIYTSGYRELGFWERNHTGDLVYTSLNPKAEKLFSKNEEFWNTVIIGDRVYFHSFSSVFVYHEGEFSVFRPDALIQSVSRIGDSLCMHLSGRGLYMLHDTVPRAFLTDPVVQKNIVQFCAAMPGDGMLIGTVSDGLYMYRDNRLEPYLPEWRDYFSKNKLNRGAVSGNGNIVTGSLMDGVVVFDSVGTLLVRINKSAGLQNNTVLGIHCDQDNDIWVSLDQGIDYISFGVDPSYDRYEVPEAGAIYAAAIFRDEIYLSTNQGVFYRGLEKEDDPFRIVPGTQGQAWSCDVIEGQLLVSHNEGTFRIENHRAERLSQVAGGLSITRNPLRRDMVIQSTYSNIVMYGNSTGRWRYAHQLEGFNDLIRYVEMDHLNNLWASHMHRGIYRLKLDSRQDTILEWQYLGDSVFGQDFDIQVFKIENRIVFTTGRMFYTYNDLEDRIIPYGALNRGLADFASAHRVVPGLDHHYWMISKSGIGLFRIDGQEITRVRVYPIGLFNQRLIDGYENILPLSATGGLLCLNNGYVILHADRPDLSGAFARMQVSLKGIEARGRSGQSEKLSLEGKSVRVPFNRNSLTVRLAFPFYNSRTVGFESFIGGLDQEWSRPMEIPEFNFTRVPYGTYTIRFRAVNEWNLRSREEQLTLVVDPPWYLSRASFILYGLLLLTMLLTGRYLLFRRIRVREQKIKDSQEKELVRLRNEKLNAELSFKSQELANSTMAIIKKNEFLMSLKETLKAQKEELGTRFPEKYHTRLVRKIDNNIASMDDWNVFEIHFEKAHEKFLQKLIAKYPHLSHSDLRLCAYLRMNLSSKEIAPLLRISYRGVENHRYRLRKKLLLKKEVNLTEFILSL